MAKYLVIVESPAKVKTIKNMIMSRSILRFVERVRNLLNYANW